MFFEESLRDEEEDEALRSSLAYNPPKSIRDSLIRRSILLREDQDSKDFSKKRKKKLPSVYLILIVDCRFSGQNYIVKGFSGKLEIMFQLLSCHLRIKLDI